MATSAPASQTQQQSMPGGLVKELIYGMASVDGPLVGATVRITALDGTPLGTTATHALVSNHTGYFYTNAAETPRDFRLVATGGTVKGVPFVGELRAEVRGHQRHAGNVAINPVTTIVSVYMAAHPERTLAEATDAVKAFLAIPASYDVGLDLLARPWAFDAAAYLAQVDAKGGHLAFAKALVAELDAGGKHPMQTPRPYHLAQEAAVAEEGLAAVMGKEFAKGAANEAGGSVMGSVLSELGLGGADASDAQFQAVYSKLEEIETKIDDLTRSLDADTNAIAAKLSQGNYQTVAGPSLRTIARQNEHVRNNLTTLARNLSNPAPTGDAVKDAAARQQTEMARQVLVDDTNSYIDDHYTDFQEVMNDALVGGGGSDSLIKLYSLAINAASPYFYSYDTAMKMQRWWDYADVVQLDAVRIKLERLRDQNTDPRLIDALMQQYNTYRTAQLPLLRGMVRKEDAMDLSAMGLPVTKVKLNSLPGSMSTYGGSYWPVTVQKRDASNNPRLALWRTGTDLANYVLPQLPAWAVNTESTYFGSPLGDQYLQAADDALALKIRRAADFALVVAGVPGATWTLPPGDDVAALFTMADPKLGTSSLGFHFDGSRPIFVAPGRYFYVSGWLPQYNYVDPGTGKLESFHIAEYGSANLDSPFGQVFTTGKDIPNGAALMRSDLPVSPDTLWYE
jgi:hypothetical protein